MANITCGYLEDGTACDYTTMDTAYAAASNGDTIQVYYSDENMCKTWFQISTIYLNTTSVFPSWIAMVEGIVIRGKVIWLAYSNGSTSIPDLVCDIDGFTFQINDNNPLNFFDSNTSLLRAVITVKNCKFIGGTRGIILQTSTLQYYDYSGDPPFNADSFSPTLKMINCEFIGHELYSIYTRYHMHLEVINCSFHSAYINFMYCNTVSNIGQASYVFKNNVFYATSGSPSTADILGFVTYPNKATVEYCAVDCTSTERGWSELSTSVSNMSFESYSNDMKLQIDAENNIFSLQPSTGSSLLGAGTPVTGVTTDINGVERDATNPSIGCYETAYSAGGGGGGGTQSFIEGTTTIKIS